MPCNQSQCAPAISQLPTPSYIDCDGIRRRSRSQIKRTFDMVDNSQDNADDADVDRNQLGCIHGVLRKQFEILGTSFRGMLGNPKPRYRSSRSTHCIVDENKLENYALNAECTHLGCSVPWDPIREQFVCPCHGSQYDATGTVLRSPAPGLLKLAKVGVEEDSEKVLLEPWFEDNNNNAWLEDNFRTGAKPWWI